MKECLKSGCEYEWLRPAIETLVTEALQAKIYQFRDLYTDELARLTINTKVVVGEERFIREIQSARVMRLKSMLNRVDTQLGCNRYVWHLTAKDEDILGCMNHDRQVVYQIHDILKAYYNLALPRYLHKYATSCWTTDSLKMRCAFATLSFLTH